MLQRMKRLLYDLIVWSGILYHITPIVFFVFQRFFLNPKNKFNHEEADEAGHRLRLSRFDGRNYPMISLKKFKSIPQIKIRNDDVLLCSYPKAGCHWVQEIMNMLVTGKIQMTKAGKELAGGIDFLSDIFLESLPSPRVLNSHLLYKELPTGVREKKVKIVLLVRNPKDSVISFFNHHKNMKKYYGYDGDFGGYFKMFTEGRLEYGSYFDYILDWDKVLKEETDNPILLVSYEELKQQQLETVMKIAEFLNVNVNIEFVEKVIKECAFDKMKTFRDKQIGSGANLYRKAQECEDPLYDKLYGNKNSIEGDWRNWLKDVQSQSIDLI